jgi:cytidine deaminase
VTSVDSNQVDELFQKALLVQKNAHAPYSGYHVASSVLMDDGKIYTGVNVENASYGGTVCAERTAIFKAISEGAKKIKAILVLIDQKDPWPPCGFCLQVISEFAEADTPVILANNNKEMKNVTLKDLLPMAFSLNLS